MLHARAQLLILALMLVACDDDDADPDGGATPLDSAVGDADAGTSSADARVNEVVTDDASSTADASFDAGPVADAGEVHACSIAESGQVLLELGLTNAPALSSPAEPLQVGAARLLSIGEDRWILWDTQRGARIAVGQAPCWTRRYTPCAPNVLQGASFLVPVAVATREVRAASDGALLGTIENEPGSYGLTPDGAYVWTANETSLAVWSPSGTLLFRKPGDYSAAKLFTTPSELRIANGPSASKIEHLALPSGASTLSAEFLGTFTAWFTDGTKFITLSGTSTRVYGLDAVQQKILALGGVGALGGYGNYLYTASNVYSLAGNDAPLPRTSNVGRDTNGILIDVDSTSHATFTDLTTTPLTQRTVVHPAAVDRYSVTATGLSDWFFSDISSGVLHGEYAGQARSLGCGAVRELALSTQGDYAIALKAGQLFVGNLARRASGRVLPLQLQRVAISPDGKTVYGSTLDGLNFNAYDTQTGALRWNLPGGEYQISSEGTRIAFTRHDEQARVWTTSFYDASGAQQPFTLGSTLLDLPANVVVYPSVVLSPSGARFAINTALKENNAANVYDGDVLVGAIAAYPVAWLDEDRLLAIKYAESGAGSAYLFDRAGNVIARPAAVAEHVDVLDGGARIFFAGSLYAMPSGTLTYTLANYEENSITRANGNTALYVSQGRVETVTLP